MNKYRVTLQHDNGTTSIVAHAKTKKDAMQIIMKVENCPSHAIKKIKKLII